jgi:hypothetical protein
VLFWSASRCDCFNSSTGACSTNYRKIAYLSTEAGFILLAGTGFSSEYLRELFSSDWQLSFFLLQMPAECEHDNGQVIVLVWAVLIGLLGAFSLSARKEGLEWLSVQHVKPKRTYTSKVYLFVRSAPRSSTDRAHSSAFTCWN